MYHNDIRYLPYEASTDFCRARPSVYNHGGYVSPPQSELHERYRRDDGYPSYSRDDYPPRRFNDTKYDAYYYYSDEDATVDPWRGGRIPQQETCTTNDRYQRYHDAHHTYGYDDNNQYSHNSYSPQRYRHDHTDPNYAPFEARHTPPPEYIQNFYPNDSYSANLSEPVDYSAQSNTTRPTRTLAEVNREERIAAGMAAAPVPPSETLKDTMIQPVVEIKQLGKSVDPSAFTWKRVKNKANKVLDKFLDR
jgi:hypothetical protein